MDTGEKGNTRMTGKTPASRVADVVAAYATIGALIQTACNASADHGDTDARTIAAWEAVEKNGATIHRQSRLLAGKNRGG